MNLPNPNEHDILTLAKQVRAKMPIITETDAIALRLAQAVVDLDKELRETKYRLLLSRYPVLRKALQTAIESK